MITFFPTPYPNELFYGVVSRYRVWSGILDNKTVLKELYGKVSITAGRQLPANFELILNNLPSRYCYNAEELIKEHTSFKFYTAFVPKEIAKKVYFNMIKDNGSNIYNVLGLSNNTVKPNNYLKYCECCIKCDRQKYGEAYWHLEHQLDGVLICRKHNKVLKVLNKSIYTANRQEFLNLDIENDVNRDKYVAVLSEHDMALQKLYCANVEKLMKSNFKFKDMNYFREMYVDKLVEKGISDNRMKLNQTQILKAFKSFYGDNYLSMLKINFDIENQYNWVTKITRKHRNIFHPLQHLLMIQFLNIDIEQLFTDKEYNHININTISKSNEEIKVRRDKWLNLQKEHKNSTISELRKFSYSTYKWLLKYDKNWLYKNSPKKKRKGNNHNIDWNKRDKEIVKLCKVAVAEIFLSEDKPQRVSIALVGRKIGKQYLLSKCLDKLEATKRFLDENVESIEQFQRRRIKWVKNKYPEMAEWEQFRVIGLKKIRPLLKNNVKN